MRLAVGTAFPVETREVFLEFLGIRLPLLQPLLRVFFHQHEFHRVSEQARLFLLRLTMLGMTMRVSISVSYIQIQ